MRASLQPVLFPFPLNIPPAQSSGFSPKFQMHFKCHMQTPGLRFIVIVDKAVITLLKNLINPVFYYLRSVIHP